MVFGWHVRAGRGQLAGFDDLAEWRNLGMGDSLDTELNPLVNSQTRPAGDMLLPVLRVQGSGATLEFPIREDAAARGLAYHVEFSETLTPGSWTVAPPPGAVVTDAPYRPAEAGGLLRSVSFDTAIRLFCRVRVELDEDS